LGDRLSDTDFRHTRQHLHSLEVSKVAVKEEAHVVANQIHNLILRDFTYRFPGADHDVQMVDMEEEGEDVQCSEVPDDDDTENDEMFDKDDRVSTNNRSTCSNATSISTGLNMLDQSLYPCQEYPSYRPPVESEIGQQMSTNWPVHSPHSASTVVYPQTNSVSPSSQTSENKADEEAGDSFSPMNFLSQAVDLASQRE